MAAKSRQFTVDKMGKGQVLRGNWRNLAVEGVVRKISSPQRVGSVSKYVYLLHLLHYTEACNELDG